MPKRRARIGLGAFAASAIAASPVSAASYEEARDAFDLAFTLEQRLTAQVLLNAAGYSAVVPSENLSRGTYAAITSFEAQNGFAASGVLTARQIARLAVAAAPALRLWGFRRIAYPGRTISIWVPAGLGMAMTEDGAGLHFRDAKGRLALDLVSRGSQTIEVAHDDAIAEGARHAATVHHDDYSKGDGWFAISSVWPDGSEHYARLQQDGPRVTGFILGWRSDVGDVGAKRMAAIMSGSLRAALSGESFVDPPTFATERLSPTSPDDR